MMTIDNKFLVDLDEIRLFKYVNFETLKLILETRTILFSPPSKFNDIFELDIDRFSFDNKIDNYLNLVRVPDFFDENAKSNYRNYCMENPDKLKYYLIDALREIRNSFGISCFALSPFINMNWAHYSDKHMGYCIEFQFTNNLVNSDLNFFYVDYSGSNEKLNYFENTENTLVKWICTKDSSWQNEREVRAVYSNFQGQFRLPRMYFRRIYSGIKSTIENDCEIKTIVKQYFNDEFLITKIKPDDLLR